MQRSLMKYTNWLNSSKSFLMKGEIAVRNAISLFSAFLSWVDKLSSKKKDYKNDYFLSVVDQVGNIC